MTSFHPAPDTTEVPTDSLEYPDAGDGTYEDLEPAQEEEVLEEDPWAFFAFPAWLGAGFTGGFCATGNYESMVGGTISYGRPTREQEWLEIAVGYTATPLTQSSSLRETIGDTPGIISMDAALRVFLTPPAQQTRFHLMVGAGVNFLFWTYNTPVNMASDEGGVDMVSDDGLVGIDLRCGAGFFMFRESGVIVSAEIIPGVKLWLDETRNGFSNDLFSSYGFLVLKVQAAFQIGG
jgi:hypothetical protein